MKSKIYRRRKFNRKRKNTYKIFFLVIIGMSLGFAAINTTLQLIGTLNISRTTWNIHWENPTKTGGVNATKEVALKENDNTTVEYQVKLTNPGDYYEFTVDAKNDGTIDGMITNISNKVYENNVEVTLPAYLESTITYSDGKTIEPNHLLASTKKETYKVKVAYKTGLYADQLPDQEKTYNFRFTVTYMQADENVQPVRLVVLPEGKTVDTLVNGDEVKIADEEFIYISKNSTNVRLLTKNNLNTSKNGTEQTTNTSPVEFSTNSYWISYGERSLYDETQNGTPGSSNYSIAYYVLNYKEVLLSKHVPVTAMGLLTHGDLSICGCNELSAPYSCSPDYMKKSFWIGTSLNSSTVYAVWSGGIVNFSYTDASNFGVRPTITVPKSIF